jgi:L-ascorbate metabolism protein UlaG (beta-lactamase superfamily)
MTGAETRATEDRIVLTWLGAAGFHVKYRGEELLLDPFLSRPMGGSRPANVEAEHFARVSLILVSHGHFDHAMDAGRLARLSGARVFAPAKTCSRLSRGGLADTRLFANERHARVEWNGVHIEVVPSRHIRCNPALVVRSLVRIVRGRLATVMFRLWRDYPKGSDSEFLLDFAGYRVLHSGSGGGDWARLSRLHPNCLLLPYSDRLDLPDYYMEAVRTLVPDTIVLDHFEDFFPPLHVSYPIEEFGIRVKREFPHIRLISPTLGVPFCLP